MESPLGERRWNFGLGAGTFLHLMCGSLIFRQPLRGGGKLEVGWLFAFPVPVWDGARCHRWLPCLTDTARAVSLLGQAKVSMSCKSRELNRVIFSLGF